MPACLKTLRLKTQGEATMSRSRLFVTIGVAVTAIAASQNAHSASSAREASAISTPPGITLQEIFVARGRAGRPVEKAAGPAANASNEPKPTPFFPAGHERGDRNNITYADAAGRTLYTYDKDTEAGKSSCVAKCAEAWPPALIAPGVMPAGDWSAIARDDKSKQWAYKGKPLYTFAQDSDVGQKKGDGAAGGVWHVAKFEAPLAHSELPYDIGVAESSAANGFVLVNGRGMTLYTSDGKPSLDKSPALDKSRCATSACPQRWAPVSAALIANPSGDFSLASRPDGIKQWIYKGKPLYTFSGDINPGDANGIGLDKKYNVAMLTRHFMPPVAAIRMDVARGPILTTVAGMTLYRRDTSFHQAYGHGLPGSSTGNPAVGRAMGTKTCEGECLKAWSPLAAAPKALPSGYWDIAIRAD
ncbi:MAG: hypothetical protein ACYCZX_15745, partial [Rhodospirillaceae bacterium]